MSESGASWTPPTVAGPLITFRGKQIAASSLDDEANAAREAGFQRGRSEGLAAAAAQIAQEMAELDAKRRLLDGLARQIVAPLERCDEETATELVQLALTVGAQLARRELQTDPAQVLAIVRECLAGLPGNAREVRIRLHPRDAAALQGHLSMGGTQPSFTVVEDPMLTRGGCLVESEASRVDARFESRVAAAFALVLGEEEGRVP
ncbi:MAG: FliH/SctL family protein [Gammaproteobacteria bacterium]